MGLFRNILSRTPRGSRSLILGVLALLASTRSLGQADNDLFIHRTRLEGEQATSSFITFRASRESGEMPPVGAAGNEGSLWWTWRAPRSGIALVTAGFDPFSGVAHRLVVAQGSRINELVSVVPPGTDQIQFPAVEGSEYQLGLIIPNGFSYAGTLQLRIPVHPDNDLFANRLPLIGQEVVGEGSLAGASPDPGSIPFLRFNTVWWSWTAPASGQALFQMTDGDRNATWAVFKGTSLEALEEQPLQALPGLNHSATFTVVAGDTYLLGIGSRSTEGRPFRFRLGLSRSHLVVTSPAERLAIGQPITLEWRGDDAAEPPGILVLSANGVALATNSPGGRTWVWTPNRSGVFQLIAHRTQETAPPEISTSLSLVVRPANDDFEQAEPLAGESIATPFFMTEATLEPGEPDAQQGSVWFRWTAPQDGQVEFSVSNWPTRSFQLRVYTGPTLHDLTLVGSGAGNGSTQPAVVALPVHRQVTYWISIDAPLRSSPGQLRTAFAPLPRNDAFGEREGLPVTKETTFVEGSNFWATLETGEESGLGTSRMRSVWYEWKAPAEGILNLQIVSWNRGSWDIYSTFHQIDVYSGGDFPNLNTAPFSRIRDKTAYRAQAGQVFWIRVSDTSPPLSRQSAGKFQLQTGWSPHLPNDRFTGRIPVQGDRIQLFDSVETALPEDQGSHIRWPPGRPAAWFDWVAPRSGRAVLRVAPSGRWVEAYVFDVQDQLLLDLVTNRVANPFFQLPFAATAGRHYAIAMVVSQPPWTFDAALGFEDTAENDRFENRTPIEGTQQSFLLKPDLATRDESNPFTTSPAQWWTWTAPATATVRLSVNGPFRSRVFTGDSRENLVVIPVELESDPYGRPVTSFACQSGTTYHWAVEIPNDEKWDPFGQFYAQLDATTLALRPVGTTEGLRPGDTIEMDVSATEPGVDGTLLSGVELVRNDAFTPIVLERSDSLPTRLRATNLQLGLNRFWLRATNSAGQVRWSSSRNILLRAPNDDVRQATRVTETQWQATLPQDALSLEADEPEMPWPGYSGSVWWKWIAPFSGYLAFDVRAGLPALYERGPPDPWLPIPLEYDPQGRFAAPVRQGHEYWVRIVGWPGAEPIQVRANLIPVQWKNPVSSDPVSGFAFRPAIEVLNPKAAVKRVDFLVNGSQVASAFHPPYEATLTLSTNRAVITARVELADGTIWNPLRPLQMRFAETNDSFAHPSLMEGPFGYQMADSTFASIEAGEPEILSSATRSLWWTWTAPDNGVLLVNGNEHWWTQGWVTQIGAFSGDDLRNLTPITSGRSSLSLEVQSGKTYRFLLQTFWFGPMDWKWSFAPQANNDGILQAAELTGTQLKLLGSFGSASREAGEPAHGNRPDGQSRWWRWVAPADGSLFWKGWDLIGLLPNGWVDRGIFTEESSQPWGRALTLNSLGSTPVVEGKTYWFVLDTPPGYHGLAILNYEFRKTKAPGTFSSPLEIQESQQSHSIAFMNDGRAVGEPNHPSCSGLPECRSMWTSWVAPSEGELWLSLQQGAVIEAYQETASHELVQVGIGPSVILPVKRGEKYRFALISTVMGQEVDQLSLDFAPKIANDDFEDALRLEGGIATLDMSYGISGREFGEPAHGGQPTFSSLWWKWRAPASGPVFLFPRGVPDSLSALAVYTGDALMQLQLVAQGIQTERGDPLSFMATEGVEYRIALATLNAHRRSLQFQLSQPAAATDHPLLILALEVDTDLLRLRIHARPGLSVQFEGSSDLLNWTPKGHLEVISEVTEVSLPLTGDEPAIFIRIVELPVNP